jgi:predicted ester cyclase
MRRTAVLPLTFVLSLSTAVALLAAGIELRAAPPAIETEAAMRAIVVRFYDAVNETIRTGDTSHLAATVAADFVDHQARPGTAPGRPGLERFLFSLRATFPELRLEVEEVIIDGDQVVARVAVRGAPYGLFVGIPLPSPWAHWGAIDVFRLAGGRIVERWGSGEASKLLEPLAETPALTLPAAPVIISLTRIAFAPGAGLVLEAGVGMTLLMVEDGSLTVRFGGPVALAWVASGDTVTQWDQATPGIDATLLPGDRFAVGAGAAVAARNDGSAQTTVLSATVRIGPTAGPLTPDSPKYPTPVDRWDGARTALDARPPGIVTQILAIAVATDLPAGSATVAVGRVTLAPDGSLALPVAAGPAVLAVETGRLGLVSTGPVPIWDWMGDGGPKRLGANVVLPEGKAVLLEAGAAGTLRHVDDAPVAVVFLKITPIGSSLPAP